MSHNKIKVGGQSPNTNGEIAVALNDLSDIDVSSASNGTLLKYDSGWTFGVPGFEAVVSGFAANNRATGTTSNTYVSGTTGRNALATDSRNAGYGQAVTQGGVAFDRVYPSGDTIAVDRYVTMSIPANTKCLLICSSAGIFTSSSGASVVVWMDSSYNYLGNQVLLEPDGRGSKKIYGYIETGASSETVHIGFVSTSNHSVRDYADGQSNQIIGIG